MKVIITGNKGFIGSYITNLMSDKDEVYSYDIKNGESQDVRDYKKTYDYFSSIEPDVVIHLAALTSVSESHNKPQDYLQTNAVGTLNVVRVCEELNVRRIVYAATAASKNPVSSPYAYSKYFGELAVRNFKPNGLPGQSIILRLFNVVGEGQNPNYLGVVPIFKDRIAKRQPVIIYGDGEQTRDFVRVEDIADIFYLAVKVNMFGEESHTIEVGTGHPITINYLAKKMIGNKKIPIIHEPERAEIKHSAAETAKLLEILHYEPKRPIF